MPSNQTVPASVSEPWSSCDITQRINKHKPKVVCYAARCPLPTELPRVLGPNSVRLPPILGGRVTCLPEAQHGAASRGRGAASSSDFFPAPLVNTNGCLANLYAPCVTQALRKHLRNARRGILYLRKTVTRATNHARLAPKAHSHSMPNTSNGLPCVTVRDEKCHPSSWNFASVQQQLHGEECHKRPVLVGFRACRAVGLAGTPGGI